MTSENTCCLGLKYNGLFRRITITVMFCKYYFQFFQLSKQKFKHQFFQPKPFVHEFNYLSPYVC